MNVGEGGSSLTAIYTLRLRIGGGLALQEDDHGVSIMLGLHMYNFFS